MLNKGIKKQRKIDGWLKNNVNKTRGNRRWLLVRSHFGPSHLRHRRGAAAPQEKKQTVRNTAETHKISGIARGGGGGGACFSDSCRKQQHLKKKQKKFDGWLNKCATHQGKSTVG